MQTGLLEDHVLSKALEWNIKAITLYSVSLFWLSTTICCDSNYCCIVNIYCNKISNMFMVSKFLAKLPATYTACDTFPIWEQKLPAAETMSVFTASMPVKLTWVWLRRHAGSKDLRCFLSWWRYVLICRNSITGSTGGYVIGTWTAYENQALFSHPALLRFNLVTEIYEVWSFSHLFTPPPNGHSGLVTTQRDRVKRWLKIILWVFVQSSPCCR